MSIFSKLFGKTDAGASHGKADAAGLAASAILASENRLNELADEKNARPAATEEELYKCFAEYFAPNQDFYSTPGSEKFKAYFGAINNAKLEMANNPALFTEATKWSPSQLLDMLNHPKPVYTNMLICGLIFRTGEYGVIKDAVYCVDFCEKIPYCIAIYLLLTAHKLPKGQRRQLIDAGDGADSRAFKAAMKSLQILDPDWSFMIV